MKPTATIAVCGDSTPLHISPRSIVYLRIGRPPLGHKNGKVSRIKIYMPSNLLSHIKTSVKGENTSQKIRLCIVTGYEALTEMRE
jgi:hypothetical protein